MQFPGQLCSESPSEKKHQLKKKQQIQYIRKLFSLSGGEKRRALEKNICQLWWGV